MDDQKNVHVIQNAYAAFGRNDIDALLGLMADDIDWHVFGPNELPMSGPRRGKPEVKRFFQQVGETWSFDRFEPRQFVAQDDLVVALGVYNGKAKSTGRSFMSEFAHVFTVRDGKVVRFREYTDTANLLNALALSASGV